MSMNIVYCKSCKEKYIGEGMIWYCPGCNAPATEIEFIKEAVIHQEK